MLANAAKKLEKEKNERDIERNRVLKDTVPQLNTSSLSVQELQVNAGLLFSENCNQHEFVKR